MDPTEAGDDAHPEVLTHLRAINDEVQIAAYSMKTRHLMVIQDRKQRLEDNPRQSTDEPLVTLLKHDSDTKGSLKEMKVEGAQRYLVASFQNGSLSVYDLRTLSMVKSFGPMSECLLNDQPYQSNMMIDESVTYLAYLHRDRKQVNFVTFDWDYEVKKLEKPNLLGEMLTKSGRRTSRRQSTRTRAKAAEKEVKQETRTCNIF